MGDDGKDENSAAKLEFDRKKAIFEQDCQEYRSLNGFLWQIPVLVSTLTGGLWFGAAKICESSLIQPAFFGLAGFVNICFIVVMWRLRKGVMEYLLTEMAVYQGRSRRSGWKYAMITVYTVLLLFSAGISFYAAYQILTGAVKMCVTS